MTTQEKINKQDIVRRVVEKLEGTKIGTGGNRNIKYSQKVVHNVINTFMDVIVDAVEEGESVMWSGYMTLEPKHYVERKARNLYEDKEITLPERYGVKLNVGSKLKEACKRLSERELQKDGGLVNDRN